MKFALNALMPLLVCISLISPSVWANAEINEYETYLYYANGMGIELSERKAERTWKSSIGIAEPGFAFCLSCVLIETPDDNLS